MAKKTNPRKIPRTEEDVRKAELKGQMRGITVCLTIVLYVLKDKFGFDDDHLKRFNQWFNLNAELLEQNKIKLRDFHTILKEDYETEIEVT